MRQLGSIKRDEVIIMDFHWPFHGERHVCSVEHRSSDRTELQNWTGMSIWGERWEAMGPDCISKAHYDVPAEDEGEKEFKRNNNNKKEPVFYIPLGKINTVSLKCQHYECSRA